MRRHFRSLRPLVLSALVAIAAACASSTSPEADISATVAPTGITIANHGDVRACYLALSRNALASVLIAAVDCEASTTSPTLAPGATVTVPWDALLAQPLDSEFVVWWWTGQFARPGAVRGTGRSGEIIVTR